MSNGLFSSLFTSANAMRAQSTALDIVGRNMANVNNPAYARQRVVYGDKGSVNTPLGSQSLGMEAVAIQQLRDRLLDRQITEETSNTSLLEAQAKYLAQAQTALTQGLFGSSSEVDTIGSNPKISGGLASSIDAFFAAWESFSTSPASTVSKQQLIAATDDVINKLHLADQRLADTSLPTTGNTLTAQMDDEVGVVNGLLTTLADLNRQIGQVEIIRPGTAVDLRDQRQAKLEELAKYMDFATVQLGSGQVGIQVRDSLGNPVDLLNLAVVQGTLARNGSNFEWTPTAGPAVTLAINSGNLEGYRQVGAAIQGYRTQLDAFVNALVTQVNTAYNSGLNGDYFAAGNLTAASISRVATVSTVVATDTGGPSGGNDRALAVAAIARNATFLNGNPAESFSRIVTAVAQDVSNNDNRLTDQKSLIALLKSQRDSYGGVSLDEEVADMMRLQRSFQAASKMMTVLDELLSRVIDSLAR